MVLFVVCFAPTAHAQNALAAEARPVFHSIH
jgi:hypothetical protein